MARVAGHWETSPVTQEEIDGYLATVEEPSRTTLETLRRSILEVVPDAEQCISYGTPAFKVDGKTVAGFAAFKSHLSYLPHSGSVFSQLGNEIVGYTSTKGALHFAAGEPLPDDLVRRLVETKLQELGFA